MHIVYHAPAAWLFVLAGMAIHAVLLRRSLSRMGAAGARCRLALLLPGGCALLLAKAGYTLVPSDGMQSPFPWCFTTGLMGLTLGTWLAACWTKRSAWTALDETAAGLCGAMCLARLGQRWLGETGVGPYLEPDVLLARLPFFLKDAWQEPLLAVFLLEALAAAAALGLTCALARRDAVPGVKVSRALTLLTVPQILLEQFRNGWYLRWRMLRVEQVFCALLALVVLWTLCARLKAAGTSGNRVYWPILAFLALAVGVAALQLALDGKLIVLPVAVCWMLYALALLGMIGLEEYAARRLTARALQSKGG